MSLLEIREDFLRISGRRDLSNDTVNRYINRGIRYLDLHSIVRRREARSFGVLTSGQCMSVFSSQCRTLTEVWLHDGESRFCLERKSNIDLRKLYPNNLANTDSGTPLYFTAARLRKHPDTMTADMAFAYLDFSELIGGPEAGYDAVLCYPPADKDYYVEVIGAFFSPPLDDTYSDNWWTVVHPNLVLHAALYELEVDYRNTQGARDWLGPILDSIQQINYDVIEEESFGVDRIRE